MNDFGSEGGHDIGEVLQPPALYTEQPPGPGYYPDPLPRKTP